MIEIGEMLPFAITFEALTGRPVLSSLWESGGALSHVRLGQDAELVLVAPATAHLIARMALRHGWYASARACSRPISLGATSSADQ